MDLTKIKLIDFFKPKNWMSVLRSFSTYDVYQGHIIEQMMFRRLECAPCVRAGSCEHCGCSMGDKLAKWADPQAECSAGKWGKMMNKEQWESYKTKFNVNFLVTYNF